MHRTIRPLAALLCLAVAAGGSAQDDKKDADKKEDGKAKIAVFTISGAVTEAPAADDPFFGQVGSESLYSLLKRLREAGKDDGIDAILLMTDGGSLGTAQTQEMRDAIAGIKASGKKVHAHATSLSLGSYSLLCMADRLTVVPTGDVSIVGLYAEVPYYRGALDLIGIEPDFLTVGTHKSAAESFVRKGPSENAETMQNWLLDSLYGQLVGMVAKGRGVEQDKVRQWIDNGPYSAEEAVANGIVDGTIHRVDLVKELQETYGEDLVFEKKYGKKKGPDVDFSSPFALFKIFGDALKGESGKADDKAAIGVVYVEGPIFLGSESSSPFPLSFTGAGAYSTPIAKALQKAADDDSIKAVVLRVNSPGGSATASEVILRSARQVADEKPLVVSMGDVAASGGYYVSMAAERIFADGATVTGSIGVVGGKLATGSMWNRFGVQYHTYQRGANAHLLGSLNTWSESEKKIVQDSMDEIYKVFTGHVTANRGDKLTKPLEDIAGGRVYTGAQALDLGLVDQLGSLDDALSYAAGKAELGEDYDVRIIPKTRNFLQILLEDGKDDDSKRQLALPAARPTAPVDVFGMASPLLERLDPAGAAMIRGMLSRLDMIQRERAVLLAPEYRFSW